MYILDQLLQRLRRNKNKILLQVQYVLEKTVSFPKTRKEKKEKFIRLAPFT